MAHPRFHEYSYENTRRVTYRDGATFVPVCEQCGRYVIPDKTIHVNDLRGLDDGPNCTCSQCGRSRMVFEGFCDYEPTKEG